MDCQIIDVPENMKKIVVVVNKNYNFERRDLDNVIILLFEILDDC